MSTGSEELKFEWDDGNINKNLSKHGLSSQEIEEAFLDDQKKILSDELHSNQESRFILLGKAFEGRIIFVVFTMRENKIRVISARDVNKKEINLYL